MKKRNEPVLSIEFSSQSTQELLGRQSVRTTFKLSERSIDALSILANQLGIKQKSLFDHLIDDDSALRVVAKEAEQYEAPEQRVPKTYVISRRTLKNLEKVSIWCSASKQRHICTRDQRLPKSKNPVLK